MEACLIHISCQANNRYDVVAHMESEQNEQKVRMLIPPNF